jgi:hypothetical protein
MSYKAKVTGWELTECVTSRNGLTQLANVARLLMGGRGPEGLIRYENQLIADFQGRVLKSTNKQFFGKTGVI